MSPGWTSVDNLSTMVADMLQVVMVGNRFQGTGNLDLALSAWFGVCCTVADSITE